VVNSKTIKIALAFVAVLGFGMAQDKAGEKPQKVAKDQAEADLIGTIMKETQADKRLEELQKWAKDNPDSQFADEREGYFLATYVQLRNARAAFDKAVQILAAHPDDFTALSTIIGYVPFLNNNNPAPADLDTAEKASNHVLNDADKVFAESNKPPTIAAPQWGTMKPLMLPLAQNTIGYIYFQRKDNARAETELTKGLQMDATQGLSSYRLAQALFNQRQQTPAKQVPAIFEYARSAVYDGPNALDAATRKALLGTATKYYTAYHGSNEGLDKMLALAKTSALPPADFTIKSTADIAKDQADADAAARAAAGPMLTLWKDLKTNLTGPDGDNYFKNTVEGSGLPGGAGGVTKFKGKLISSKPALRPKEITIAIESPTVADCTLKLEEGSTLPGSMEPGGDIEFDGTAKAFTKEPFMLTFEVTKEQIVGWTGKGAAPSTPKKTGPATAKKKAQ
jgi:tetratricopeptide (TPR) repeat protein